jgi:hypothetical protein
LNDRVSQPTPELFGFFVERCAAGNDCPELPSKLSPNAAKRPPAAQKMLPFRRSKALTEPVRLSFIF